MIIGRIKHKTIIRLRNMDEFEKYINAIDIDYDSADMTFTGYVFKFKTPHFNVVKRSAYATGTDYLMEVVEHNGQNCFFPKSGHCFIKCINYFTEKSMQKNFNFHSN